MFVSRRAPQVEQEVAAGRFRRDLFHRLNAVTIMLPPLRERPEDIPPLAQKFRRSGLFVESAGPVQSGSARVARTAPLAGNIRELENAVVRAVAMCDGTIRVKGPAAARSAFQ